MICYTQRVLFLLFTLSLMFAPLILFYKQILDREVRMTSFIFRSRTNGMKSVL